MSASFRTAAAAIFLLLAAVPPAVNAETEAERWGRAQTQHNSYEANQQSRQRNSRPIQLESINTGSSNTSSAPRSSSEILSEHQRKMDAMHERWRDECTDAADYHDCWQQIHAQRKEKARLEKLGKDLKTYVKVIKKAESVAFKSEEKWLAFVQGLPAEQRGWLKTGVQASSYEQSPWSALAREYLAGQRTSGKLTPEEAARVVLQRGVAMGDVWSAHDLGLFESASEEPGGEARAVAVYETALARAPAESEGESTGYFETLVKRKGAAAVRLKLVRAYAYGWGVPEDREQAVKHFQVLVSEGEFRDAAGLFSPYRIASVRQPSWADGVTLYAEFLDKGIGMQRDRMAAQQWLQRALVEKQENAAWKVLLTLLSIGGDLSDAQRSYEILNTALQGKQYAVGGEVVYRQLKGVGVTADANLAYQTAVALPGMPPQALSRVVRLWLGNDGVTRDAAKAQELLQRFADPQNAEHAQLLAEVKNSG